MANSPPQPDIPLLLLHAFPADKYLASAPPSAHVKATANYYASQQAISKGLSLTVFKKDATTWSQWQRFFSWLQITSDFQGIEDPIPLLHIFPRAFVTALCPCRGIPSRSDQSRNTSASLVKYLHLWGPTTPTTI